MECQADLDATFIKPDRCNWHRDFLIELKDTLGFYGDVHLQTVLDCTQNSFARQGSMSSLSLRSPCLLSLFARYKPFREYCNFPILVIDITANRLEISVAVCIRSMYMTRLLTLDLSLGFHTSDSSFIPSFVTLSDESQKLLRRRH